MSERSSKITIPEADGFVGFIPVAQLRNDIGRVPTTGGIYIVVRDSDVYPTFLEIGTGGFHKDRDPNVPISTLEANYVTDSKIMYIGKATSLRKRVLDLLRFGAGASVGHYGGRLLWQLADSNELLIAWKETPNEDPREVEAIMLKDFAATHGCLPFANLKF